MSEKLTEELLRELQSKPLDCFVYKADIANEFTAQNLPHLLDSLLVDKDIKKSDVIKSTDINATHLYQIFSGERGASRDKVLQIALALSVGLKDANRLLNAAGVSELYCKNRRDAIIIYCIQNKCSVYNTNQTLYEFNEDTLSE